MRKILWLCCFMSCSLANNQQSCLYKNPLCFYNTDVLTYLQVLHKNQQYQQMIPFIYGPVIKNKSRTSIAKALEREDWGYSIKRVGIVAQGKGKWSLTYRRMIQGTYENFKINCARIHDTCRLYLDQKQWNLLFRSKTN